MKSRGNSIPCLSMGRLCCLPVQPARCASRNFPPCPACRPICQVGTVQSRPCRCNESRSKGHSTLLVQHCGCTMHVRSTLNCKRKRRDNSPAQDVSRQGNGLAVIVRWLEALSRPAFATKSLLLATVVPFHPVPSHTLSLSPTMDRNFPPHPSRMNLTPLPSSHGCRCRRNNT